MFDSVHISIISGIFKKVRTPKNRKNIFGLTIRVILDTYFLGQSSRFRARVAKGRPAFRGRITRGKPRVQNCVSRGRCRLRKDFRLTMKRGENWFPEKI